MAETGGEMTLFSTYYIINIGIVGPVINGVKGPLEMALYMGVMGWKKLCLLGPHNWKRI